MKKLLFISALSILPVMQVLATVDIETNVLLPKGKIDFKNIDTNREFSAVYGAAKFPNEPDGRYEITATQDGKFCMGSNVQFHHFKNEKTHSVKLDESCMLWIHKG
jgi:hypothetical protein